MITDICVVSLTDECLNGFLQDAWAICRIFKKANSSAQRALSHSWVSPLPETRTITTTTSDFVTQHVYGSNIFSSNEMPLVNKNSTGSVIQFGDGTSVVQQSSIASFSPLDTSPYKSIMNQINNNNEVPSQLPIPKCDELPTTSTFPTIIPTSDQEPSACTTIDASSMLLSMSSSVFGDFDDKSSQDQYFHNFSVTVLPDDQDMRRNINHAYQEGTGRTSVNDPNVALKDQQWGTMQSVGYPLINLPLNNMADAWKCNFFWDSSPCPSSDISTSFSTNNCYS